MKSISLVNKKGGVGKSTTLAILASFYANSGKKIGVIDKDENQDSASFVEDLDNPNIEMFNSKKAYDLVLIDTGGGVDDSECSEIEENSSLVILPTELDMLEIKNTVRTSNLFNDQSKVRILLTRLQKGTKEYQQKDTIKSAFSAKVFKTVLHDKKQYKRVIGLGYESFDKSGIYEVSKLIKEIDKIL